jgi:hypothetical protein
MFLTGLLMRSYRVTALPRGVAEQKENSRKLLPESSWEWVWVRSITLRHRLLTLTLKRLT